MLNNAFVRLLIRFDFRGAVVDFQWPFGSPIIINQNGRQLALATHGC